MVKRLILMELFITICLCTITAMNICLGQNEDQISEERITIIDFWAQSSDTTIIVYKYDLDGNLIQNRNSYLIGIPLISIDTTIISGTEKRLVYSWGDGRQTIELLIDFEDKKQQIHYSSEQNDTIFISTFSKGRGGSILNGYEIIYKDTTDFILNGKTSLEELYSIRTAIWRYSSFVDFVGIVKFITPRKIEIVDRLEERNKVVVWLNKDLQPRKLVKKRWHEYHQMQFVNKYSYDYELGRLVQIVGRDNYGDIELIKRVEYIKR